MLVSVTLYERLTPCGRAFRTDLYGCEPWSLTLREEHRLRVFENRLLRRLFGLKRDEITGEWRKFHGEERHEFYFSPHLITMIISRTRRQTENSAHMGRIEMHIKF
jgi:hypothetical protein